MSRPAWRPASSLFAFGFALRVCFWLAGGDAGAAWQAGFQGDAWLWQDLAAKVANDRPDELLRLPLRPPGMQWLVATLWDGAPGGAWPLLLLFATLGAAVAPLLFLLLRTPLGERAAVAAGATCAAASPLLLTGSGLHNELPYLLLFLLSLFDQRRLAEQPSTSVALRWGVVHALLVLLRAEHVLTFAALLLLLWLCRPPRRLRTTLLALAAATLALLPWHVAAWRMVDDYNRLGAPDLPPAGVAVPGGLPWQASALDRLRSLPAFQQAPVFGFVQDTMRTRGAREVTDADLDVVIEAYGCWPERLPRPFVCLYGGLNFFLANTPEADGGFHNAALDRPPPLAGGDARYPRGLRRVLPRGGQLALSYPPHLDALVHGYRRGFRELASDPRGSIGRIGTKLWQTAKGAVPTLGGLALPIGLSGERRAVDMVVATGWWADAWRAVILTLAAVGWWRLRGIPTLRPWIVFALTKIVIAAAFYGYARQGTLLLPVVAIGLAPYLARLPCRRRCVAALAAGMLAVEIVRTLCVTTRIDGESPPTSSPVDHGGHRIDYALRWR